MSLTRPCPLTAPATDPWRERGRRVTRRERGPVQTAPFAKLRERLDERVARRPLLETHGGQRGARAATSSPCRPPAHLGSRGWNVQGVPPQHDCPSRQPQSSLAPAGVCASSHDPSTAQLAIRDQTEFSRSALGRAKPTSVLRIAYGARGPGLVQVKAFEMDGQTEGAHGPALHDARTAPTTARVTPQRRPTSSSATETKKQDTPGMTR